MTMWPPAPWAHQPGPSVVEANLRVFKHEAETPPRDHEEDGSCCRSAYEGP